MRLLLFVAVAGILVIFESGANGLFVYPTTTVIRPYPQLKLKIVDELPFNQRVEYEGFAYDAGKSASIPNFALSLDVKFTKTISEQTFNILQKKYCGWSETKSRVKYNPNILYKLTDFLPPLLQACNGLHFKSSNLSTPTPTPTPTPTSLLSSSSWSWNGRDKDSSSIGLSRLPSFLNNINNNNNNNNNRVQYSKQDVLLAYNCWGFAWEVLFQADNKDVKAMTISTADPTSAWKAFTSSGFDLIQTTVTKPKLLNIDNIQQRNEKLQPGDVLLIWHRNPSTVSGTDLYLDHVATYIDNDLYYEKSGNGNNVPFRISTWEMITNNFPPSVFFWEWRRLIRNNPLSPNLYGNTERLQSAEEIFGVDSQAQQAATTDTNNFWSAFNNLDTKISRKISLQLATDDNNDAESQLYTGILVLEDIRYSKKTGRAKLPRSAFDQSWYQTAYFDLDDDRL